MFGASDGSCFGACFHPDSAVMKLWPEASSAKPSASILVSFSKHPVVLSVILFLLAAGTFLPTLKNGFIIFDDPIYVLNNSHVNHGLTWSGLRWAFYGTAGGIWLPLTWISHMLDCQFYGLHAWGHHLSSVLIHGANTTLVFLWLFRMTGAKWRSFMVAALFGLHPLRVESVAWVAERKDVLSALFWLLTLMAYTEYVKKSENEGHGAKRVYWLTLALFTFGLMAKPMTMTLPFVLLLLDDWPLRRFQSGKTAAQLVVEKLPFFILSVIAGIITIAVQRNENMVMPLNRFPLFERFENAAISYVAYIGKLFWPANLSVFYPFPHYLSFLTFLSAALLLMVFSAFVVWQRQRAYFMTGWLWYLGTLIPIIGLVQVGQQAMADRYTYIPQIGLLVCLVWGIADLTRHWKWRPFILPTAGVMAIAACMILTCRQIALWRDSETLFEHAVAVTKDNVIAQINLGNAFARNGQVDEAIVHFQKALAMDSSYADAHYNLGTAFFQKEQFERAIAQYQKAMAIQPGYQDARDNLGIAHLNFGLMLSKEGKISEAITNCQMAVKFHPSAEAYNDLGNLLLKTGRLDEAIVQYQKALALEPDGAEFHRNISIAFFEAGRRKEAIASAERALQLANAQTNHALASVVQKQLEVYRTSNPAK